LAFYWQGQRRLERRRSGEFMTAPSEELANLAKPGEVLMGKYRVERVLGVGGMGAVVEARHIQLDDRVAIKFLLASMSLNGEVIARFLREGKAAAKIRNEHVVRVFDVGTLENGAPYMVMEFLQGHDLANIVAEHGKMPVAQAIDWVLEACEAIAEAHAAGIVHRDLKPANLFVHEKSDGSHTVKVLDFGISKLSEAADAANFGITKTQAVMGSPRYMSPEQMRSSRNVDARSDIWALGTVLHELLSGAPPFDAETMPELCARILAEPPPSLWKFRQDLPQGLEEALIAALQKDPSYRYQNVAQFAAALAPFGSPAATTSAQRAARLLKVTPGQFAQSDPNARISKLGLTPPPAGTHPSTANAWSGSQANVSSIAPKKSGAMPWIIGGAVGVFLLGAIGVGGVVIMKRSGSPAAPATTSAGLVTPPPTTAAAAPPATAEPSSLPTSTTTDATTTPSATPPPATAKSTAPPPATAAQPPKPPAPQPTAAPKPKPTSNPFDDR
jgi:serine/threonine protein kinase